MENAILKLGWSATSDQAKVAWEDKASYPSGRKPVTYLMARNLCDPSQVYWRRTVHVDGMPRWNPLPFKLEESDTVESPVAAHSDVATSDAIKLTLSAYTDRRLMIALAQLNTHVVRLERGGGITINEVVELAIKVGLDTMGIVRGETIP